VRPVALLPGPIVASFNLVTETLPAILGAPIAAALGLYFLVPNYFRPMFSNPLGWFMLALAAIMLGVGNFIIRRLTAIT